MGRTAKISRSLATPASPRANDPKTSKLAGARNASRFLSQTNHHRLLEASERKNDTNGLVLWLKPHECRRTRLTPGDDPEVHQVCNDGGGLLRAYSSQTGSCSNSHLRIRARQYTKHSALHSRYQSLNGATVVHAVVLL
jgi:hypothetical protein